MIADEKGSAYLVNGTDGSVISSVSLGSASHASITKVSDEEYLAVTTDGVLHVLNVSGTTISETGSAKFADRSTSTAVVSNGVAFIGGSTGTSWPYEGTLSAIDLSCIGEAGYVPQTIEVGNGAVQSTPLVVSGGTATAIYVTMNSNPGGLSLVSHLPELLHRIPDRLEGGPHLLYERFRLSLCSQECPSEHGDLDAFLRKQRRQQRRVEDHRFRHGGGERRGADARCLHIRRLVSRS